MKLCSHLACEENAYHMESPKALATLLALKVLQYGSATKTTAAAAAAGAVCQSCVCSTLSSHKQAPYIA